MGGDGLTFYCGDRHLDLLSEPLCSSARKQAVNNARLRPQYLKKNNTQHTQTTLWCSNLLPASQLAFTLCMCVAHGHISACVCGWVNISVEDTSCFILIVDILRLIEQNCNNLLYIVTSGLCCVCVFQSECRSVMSVCDLVHLR